MPWFSGGGSGGGLTSVATDATLSGNGTGGSPLSASPIQNSDGVTLQGNGTAASKYAIKAVQVAARLSGNGAVGTPLDIAGWPLTGYANSITGNTASFAATANVVVMLLFALPYALTFSKIAIQITTADAVGNYDLGLYNLTGTLVANLGAVHFPATGAVVNNTLQGAQTIAPGMYWFSLTGTATTMKYEGANNCLSLAFANSATASAGGVLPASVTPPAITPNSNNAGFLLL